MQAALVQLNPKECLIAAGETTPQVVRDVLEHTNCLITEKKKGINYIWDFYNLVNLRPIGKFM